MPTTQRKMTKAPNAKLLGVSQAPGCTLRSLGAKKLRNNSTANINILNSRMCPLDHCGFGLASLFKTKCFKHGKTRFQHKCASHFLPTLPTARRKMTEAPKATFWVLVRPLAACSGAWAQNQKFLVQKQSKHKHTTYKAKQSHLELSVNKSRTNMNIQGYTNP